MKENGIMVEKKEFILMTRGINMEPLKYIKGIDKRRSIYNDINFMYEMYGIESARSMIYYEIKNVFERTGKDVNSSHIKLISDFMTNTGNITAFNRFGLNKLDRGPLEKASFEKTLSELTDAAVFNQTDTLKSVSSSIIAGKIINGGTGIVKLVLDENKFQKKNEKRKNENENENINQYLNMI